MAIDEILDEHEQGERVRNWLRSNALALIIGLAIGLGVIFGFRWWQDQQHQARMADSDAFRTALADVANGEVDKAKAVADRLGGTYADLIALDTAKHQLSAGKADAALATLQAVKTADPALDAVVRQRLARLLIDAGKADDALAVLANAEGASAREIRGDAHFALGQIDQARSEYQAAVELAPLASPQRGLLELKLGEAGGKIERDGAAS